MTPGDWIVLTALGLLVGAIAGNLWKNRKKGCCTGCKNCKAHCQNCGENKEM